MLSMATVALPSTVHPVLSTTSTPAPSSARPPDDSSVNHIFLRHGTELTCKQVQYRKRSKDQFLLVQGYYFYWIRMVRELSNASRHVIYTTQGCRDCLPVLIDIKYFLLYEIKLPIPRKRKTIQLRIPVSFTE